MVLTVDPDSHVPPYEQIREQLVELIMGNQLSDGSRLPSVRQLASDLALAPGTVARAYRELEQDGYIKTKGRHGTFVQYRPDKSEERRTLLVSAEALALRAKRLGASEDEAISLVRSAFNAAEST